MNNDSKSFLYSQVNQASDAELFASHYSLCSTEEALKGNFDMSGKPVIVYGTAKRIELTKKKLTQIYSKKGLTYQEGLVAFILSQDIASYVQDKLISLLEGGVPEVIKEPEQHEVIEEQKVSIEKTIAVSEIEQGAEEVAVTEPITETTEEALDSLQDTNTSSGNLCSYGVMKFKLEHISPDVMGLKESLNSDIDEDYIKEYFKNVVPKLSSLVNI